MENKELIITCVAIILWCIVGGIILDNVLPSIDPLLSGKTQIRVESTAKFNGSIEINTFSNVKANENGSYNRSQFVNSTGYYIYTGDVIRIPIVDGKATFYLPNDVQFFTIYPCGFANSKESENAAVKISFYSNGVLITDAVDVISHGEFWIRFGRSIYDVNGERLFEDSFVDDVDF